MACFLYEGVLLFGVLFIAGYLYSSLTQQRHALNGRHGLQIFLFVVLGIYFTWFWSHGGQTVAMKAWHIRVVDERGLAVSQSRAFARYLLSWLWFAPALVLLYLSQVRSAGEMATCSRASIRAGSSCTMRCAAPDWYRLPDSGIAACFHRTMTSMTNEFKGRKGLERVVRATGYSLTGLKSAYQGEAAFRQETWFAVVLLPISFWLGRSWTETAVLAGSVALVLIVELLNSSIEAAVDRVSFELHDLSKRAKDLASAAVFVSLVLCAVVWTSAVWARVSSAT
jgi:diacylglycerol kinase (ATP)